LYMQHCHLSDEVKLLNNNQCDSMLRDVNYPVALSGPSQYFCPNWNWIAKNGWISGQPEPDIRYIPTDKQAVTFFLITRRNLAHSACQAFSPSCISNCHSTVFNTTHTVLMAIFHVSLRFSYLYGN